MLTERKSLEITVGSLKIFHLNYIYFKSHTIIISENESS